jgi:hypothetical protein
MVQSRHRIKIGNGAQTGKRQAAILVRIYLIRHGETNLTHFEVWAYQVNPQQVSVGDPP